MGPLFRIRNDSGIEFWCAFWCVSDFLVVYMISGSDFFFFFIWTASAGGWHVSWLWLSPHLMCFKE